ncbi:hypothetical protein GGI42DRAFT_130731 [Trichoderma sp. SZMC 28013]
MGKASRPFMASKRRRADTVRQAGMQLRAGRPIRSETTPPVPNCRVRALPVAEEAASRTLEGGKRTDKGGGEKDMSPPHVSVRVLVLHTVRGDKGEVDGKGWEGAERRKEKKGKQHAAFCFSLLFSLCG